MSRQIPHAEPEDVSCKISPRQTEVHEPARTPHNPTSWLGHLKQKLKTKDDIPSPAEAKRLTQWNGVLPRQFSKVTQSYCQHWFHTSGDDLWTLRAWGKQSMPGTCHVYLVIPVFWTPTPLCSFHSKHHVTLTLTHKGHMFFKESIRI